MSANDTSDTSSSGSPTLPKFVGKYKIIRMIARSNDVVYEALDPHLGRHVALKELILPADIQGAAKRERIERFSREARAAGALKHPNIVTIYEVGQHLEHRFIAMEYLEGQTLRELIHLRGPMPINEALQIGLQLCDAAGYAHTQGVVHRDVKPDNIHLVQPNQTVKLTDFGIARMLMEPSITAAGQVFGTPSYMSPEQLTSRTVDHRTDIFSTAVVIFEMITGKKPFRGDSIVTITYQIMSAEAVMPPTMPQGIANILTKALAKDPDQRYQNMRTLAGDLRKELAFHDSPRHTPTTPSDVGGKTVLSGMPQQTTVLQGIGAVGGMATTRTVAPLDAKSATAQIMPTTTTYNGSLLTAIDSDANVRSAILRLSTHVLAIAVMVVVTIGALLAAGQRVQENLQHHQSLGAYDMALTDASSGNLGSAINEYRTALTTLEADDPLYGRCRRGMSDCYTAQAAKSQQAGDLQSAQEAYNEAIKADFSNPVAHFDLATVFNTRGDTVSALKEFTTAYRQDPFSIAGVESKSQASTGYLQLGSQDYADGNTGRARQNWQMVIDLDPSSSDSDQAREKMSQLPQ